LYFFVAAAAEIGIGLFVYQFLDPEKAARRGCVLRWNWLRVEAAFLDFAKDLRIIKAVNKRVLQLCFFIAALILVDGALVRQVGLIDLKEELLIGTVIAILPVIYLYMFVKKKGQQQKGGTR
jgi:hypothetical protein